MIQELFGGSGGVGILGGEGSKLSTPPCGGGGGGGGGSGGGGGRFSDHGSPSPSPSPTPSPSSSASAAAAAAAESLRCPRCDSSNTKFCYYNNYNLTQPRHFCKTCRRYWTKGGALRNVPIGGGCRKNKTTIITAAVAKSAAKFKAAPPPSDARAGLFGGFEHADAAPLPSNPIMWASSQNSHFLSLLRANQTLSPSHLSMKEEGPIFGSDNLGPAHFPSMGPSNPFYRNQTLTSQGILHGETQNNGLQLQDLYRRLRLSSSSNCYPEQNMASATSSSTSAAILESAPVAAPDQMGFWNSNISWPSDLSTANGAYP